MNKRTNDKPRILAEGWVVTLCKPPQEEWGVLGVSYSHRTHHETLLLFNENEARGVAGVLALANDSRDRVKAVQVQIIEAVDD